MDPVAFFQNSHALQVRPVGPVGSPLREASIVTKGGGFTASFALCHCQKSFRDMVTRLVPRHVLAQSKILPQSVSLFKN
jgi:hypothetical protein